VTRHQQLQHHHRTCAGGAARLSPTDTGAARSKEQQQQLIPGKGEQQHGKQQHSREHAKADPAIIQKTLVEQLLLHLRDEQWLSSRSACLMPAFINLTALQGWWPDENDPTLAICTGTRKKATTKGQSQINGNMLCCCTCRVSNRQQCSQCHPRSFCSSCV
jgi:hypothetical protein